jgi:hypothetical protein
MDIASLNQQLDEHERRYQEWSEPINKATEVNFKNLVNRGGYTSKDFERDIQRMVEERRAQYDPYQLLYALFDQLCPYYLEATPQERTEIRAATSDKAGVLSALLGYIHTSASRLQSSADGEWLRKGLAAASIENCSVDYRDVLLALAELYVAAENAGIDPKPHFAAVAELSSSDTPQGGTTPMRKMLADFHSYAVLKERQDHNR